MRLFCFTCVCDVQIGVSIVFFGLGLVIFWLLDHRIVFLRLHRYVTLSREVLLLIRIVRVLDCELPFCLSQRVFCARVVMFAPVAHV